MLRLVAIPLAAAALAAGCGGGDAPGEDARSGARDAGVVLAEVSDHPEPLYGHSVTISGAVRRVLSDRALVLGRGDDDVLVVAARAAADRFRRGDVLAATGVVRRLDRLPLSRYGIGRGELAGAVREGGVVVARRLDPRPPARSPAGGDTESPVPSGFRELQVTLGAIVERPERFAGRAVAVSGEVERVVSPRAFVLGDEQLLVVTRNESGSFAEATAVVAGVVRLLTRAELEREVGVAAARALAGSGRRPVVIARRVRLVR